MSGRRGWIKICGLTSSESVTAAMEAGADAIGFVFAASPRRITAAEAARLAGPARGHLRCVAVFKHPSAIEVNEVLDVLDPDIVQTDHVDAARLPQRAIARFLPVYRESGALPTNPPRRLLFEGISSGSGRTADWNIARSLAGTTELVLAGGLGTENVVEAIRTVRPFGVDVSSGVETSLGIKSVQRIHDFVRAARAAFEELTV